MNELVQLLYHLEDSRFYGSVELRFEAGHITIKKTESIKLGTGGQRNNRGHAHEQAEA